MLLAWAATRKIYVIWQISWPRISPGLQLPTRLTAPALGRQRRKTMKNFIVIGTLSLLLLIAGNSLFVVKETERAVMLQFGEVVNADIPPVCMSKFPGLTPFVN